MNEQQQPDAENSAAKRGTVTQRKILMIVVLILALVLLATLVFFLIGKQKNRGGTRYKYAVTQEENSFVVTLKGKFQADSWYVKTEGNDLTVVKTKDEKKCTVYEIIPQQDGNYTVDFIYYDNTYIVHLNILRIDGCITLKKHQSLDYQMTALWGGNSDFAYTITRSTAGVLVVMEKRSNQSNSSGQNTFTTVADHSLMSVKKRISQADSSQELFTFNADRTLGESILIIRPGQTTALQLTMKKEQNGVLTVTDAQIVEYADASISESKEVHSSNETTAETATPEPELEIQPETEPLEEEAKTEGGNTNGGNN